MASDFDIILQAPDTPTSTFDIVLYKPGVTNDILIIWLEEESPAT
jgi:hypothetical protein